MEADSIGQPIAVSERRPGMETHFMAKMGKVRDTKTDAQKPP